MSAPTTETLSQRVIELISKKFDIPQEQISLDSQFMADLGFDSLDKIEFAMVIEEEFDITVPDEVGDNILTVRDAVEAIQKLIT